MEYFQQLVAVAGVLTALGAALWWLRRQGWAGRGWAGRGWAGSLPKRRRELECVERLSLGPQHSLHLVRAGGRLMLVASSPSGCALIGHLREPAAILPNRWASGQNQWASRRRRNDRTVRRPPVGGASGGRGYF